MSTSEQIEELPELSSDYALSQEQIDAYQRDGHTVLRGVTDSAETTAYRSVITSLVAELNTQTTPLHERGTYGKAFIQIGNLWQKNEAAKRFVLARRFAKIAAELMGVDSVRIYHDQALFKEPGGGHTPWHQDQVYWPLATDKTITMWMPLVPITEEIGSMTFASASHLRGMIDKVLISDESHRTLQQYLDGKGFAKVNYGAMAAGDATFHSGWTLHSAPGNPTDTMREVMTIIYYADGTRISEPATTGQENDMRHFYPGLQPGDLAANELTPVAYQRG